MRQEYKDWIEEHYPDYKSSKNQCNIAIVAMRRKFPELNIQVGYANNILHCWLITDDGEIIDPTVKQFKGKEVEYRKIADRFLDFDEFEPSTGAIFLKY